MNHPISPRKSATIANIPLWGWLAFIIVCLLPICILRDYTPANELRYISIADEALRNGHWFTLTNHGVPYSDKPPFYFWLIMLVKKLTDTYPMGILVLFSLLPALGVTLTMDRWCREALGEKFRMLAPLMLITTGYYAGTALVLRMDMLMVWFIVLALYRFYRMYQGDCSPRNQLLFGLYILLGFYAKAFMGLLIPLVTSALFLLMKKEIRTFGRYWSWRVWTVLLGGLIFWFGMVYVEAGSEYLYNLTVGQTMSRSVNVSVHKHPFYFYLIFLSYGVAPWTLLYVGNLIWGFRHKAFTTDLHRLFVIEILSTFVLLSCFGSKLAIYLVPIFPFMTYLSLMMLEQQKWNGWLATAVSLPAIAVIAALPAYIIFCILFPTFSHPALYAASALLTGSAIMSLHAAWSKRRSLVASIQIFCVGFLIAAFAVGLALPRFNDQIGYDALARETQQMEKEWQTEGVATYGVWRAENMDVYFPERLRVFSKKQTDSLELLDNHLLIVDKKMLKQEKVIEVIQNKKQKEIINGTYLLVRMKP